MSWPASFRLLVCICLAAAAWLAAPGPPPLRTGLAILALVASLWFTQALPLAVTALLVPALAVLTGLQQPVEALSPFASPILFLFLGGFTLAAALRKQGLDLALARLVLRLAKGRRAAAVLLVAALTALLSMWMSNTAAAVLMLPVALGLLDAQDAQRDPGAEAFTLLAVTYSTALGGMASIVSTPPNALAAAQAQIGFTQWFVQVAPVALVLWLAMLALLWTALRPRLAGRVPAPTDEAFTWTRARLLTAAIAMLTVIGWVGAAQWRQLLGVQGDITPVIALLAIVAFVASGALGWPELEREVQWGVLLLFGGGLALSEVLADSGGSRFLVDSLLGILGNAPAWLVVLALVALILVLSEFMSNTATAALALPLFLPLAPALGLSPVALAIAIALASSCGFMLPVATPPNAMVFGTGRVTQATMVRCGWRLDLVCVLAITVAAQWLWN